MYVCTYINQCLIKTTQRKQQQNKNVGTLIPAKLKQ